MLIRSLFKTRIFGNISWLVAGHIYQMVLTFLVGIFSARYLGPANYGLINYSGSLVTLFTAFCTLGTENILVNELVNQPEKEGTICGTTIGMRLVSSSFSIVLILLLTLLLNPEEPLTFYVTAIYSTTLLFRCFESINYWFQAKMLSKYNAIISAVAFTGASVYKVFLLVANKNVLWFAATNVVQYIVIAILLLICYRRQSGDKQPLKYDRDLSRTIFSKSYHFILSGMMVAIYGQMDKIMLKTMLDETAVGLYTAGASISDLWVFVLSAIVVSVRPIILESFSVSRKKYETNLKRLYAIVIYLSFFVAVFLSLLARVVIRLLYGEAFIEADSIIRILTWSTAFSYMGVVRGMWVVPYKIQRYEKYIAAAGTACNLLFNSLLIPSCGANGAALATLITQFFTNFVMGFLIKDIRQNNIIILASIKRPLELICNRKEGRQNQ